MRYYVQLQKPSSQIYCGTKESEMQTLQSYDSNPSAKTPEQELPIMDTEGKAKVNFSGAGAEGRGALGSYARVLHVSYFLSLDLDGIHKEELSHEKLWVDAGFA